MTASTEYKPGPVPLPYISTLGVKESELDNVDVDAVVEQWLSEFRQGLESKDLDNPKFRELFYEDGYWRDILSLTWDYRTFRGLDSIFTFLKDRLPDHSITNIKLDSSFDPVTSPSKVPDAKVPSLENSVPGLYWITAFFTFDTKYGECSGIFRLIPHNSGRWQAFTVFTLLETIHGHPENLRERRPHSYTHGTWQKRRDEEKEFKDKDPTVLILGAGQSGLTLAARLKAIGISSLMVGQEERVGDIWRNRYRFLTLHDPVWYDHMAYLPFPESWPVFAPAAKLANWLEAYAETFELNCWLKSTIEFADFDEKERKWTVTIRRGDGSKRVMKVEFLVFATGLAGGAIKFPNIEGMDKFNGKILHSTQHKFGSDFTGKHVVVVGSGTSGHDISQDLYQNDVAVTMVQRSPTYIMSVEKGVPIMLGSYKEGGPPADYSDRVAASFPLYVAKGLNQYAAKAIEKADKELLERLNAVGFKTTLGIDDSGFLLLALQRAGGYYLDVGCSGLIADQKIKLKSGEIKKFTSDTLVFEDGSELKADAVIFCTGYGDRRGIFEGKIPQKLQDRLHNMWGLDNEMEMKGAWRSLGVPHLFYMAGNLAWGRFHSRSVANQILGMHLGLFEEEDRYRNVE